MTALEREPAVDAIIGMARRLFDPSSRGRVKTVYQQGDILDQEAVEALVAQADVVIHLPFIIMGSRAESTRINLQGTRNVFEAAVAGSAASRTRRLVYTSSVAAYGYHCDNPVPLTEDVPARGSPERYYSAQKAACEALLTDVSRDSPLEVFVLRPCIVAGHTVTALADVMPWNRLPGPVRALSRAVPMLKPVAPDPGFPLQLVHNDDVAAAIVLVATAPARPGVYNIAGDGVVTVADVARALGGRAVRVPAAAAASAAISRVPFVLSMLEWLHVARTSVVMDTTKAKTALGWRPLHSSAEALAALASAV